MSSEERWGFEAYSEQPVLSPSAEEVASTPARFEHMGKNIVAAEESSTAELLSLLKDMKEEVR